MTNLFQDIASLQSLPGWCQLDKSLTLASLILSYRPEITVEIGVFGGRSLIPMALAHKAIGSGLVIGIDAWSKDVAMREQTCDEDRAWWSALDYQKIYRDFIGEINKRDLSKWARIVVNDSLKVIPPTNIGVLHVDGAHSVTAANDMMRFGPHVVRGGFLVTDDTTWTGGGVALGEKKILDLGFKPLYKLGTGAVFQRL